MSRADRNPWLAKIPFNRKEYFTKSPRVFQTATVRNLLTRQQSSKYYYQVCESSNSISCLKFHIEKKCWGIINLDNHYSINPLSLHAILNFSFFFVTFRFVSFRSVSFRFVRFRFGFFSVTFRFDRFRFVLFDFVSFLFRFALYRYPKNWCYFP
jgi:hypothetical protein